MKKNKTQKQSFPYPRVRSILLGLSINMGIIALGWDVLAFEALKQDRYMSEFFVLLSTVVVIPAGLVGVALALVSRKISRRIAVIAVAANIVAMCTLMLALCFSLVYGAASLRVENVVYQNNPNIKPYVYSGGLGSMTIAEPFYDSKSRSYVQYGSISGGEIKLRTSDISNAYDILCRQQERCIEYGHTNDGQVIYYAPRVKGATESDYYVTKKEDMHIVLEVAVHDELKFRPQDLTEDRVLDILNSLEPGSPVS